MLVGDLPGTIDLAQPDRQAQARRAVLGELLLRAAAQQRGHEFAVSPAVTSSSAISKVPSPFSYNRRTVTMSLIAPIPRTATGGGTSNMTTSSV